ncbi:MAG TPA: sigma 54-interacting transcriptional regulator, partial [Oligoflexia bacterium]|nr:sigma 54-interacting transcriptional regulator [Oligoflexia bacterium]
MIDIQTQDSRMKDITRLAETASQSKACVLVQGETGTGKGSIAKFIHERSPRNGASFVTLNCAQQPEMLLETEIFGFEKGAFAGTVSEKRGKFEQATGGTLVLDDVSELTPKLQAKVLKVLENNAVERIGSRAGVPVDVRIIAISNKNLADLVAQGKFSEALYYKLNGILLMVPPLRERMADIKAIVSQLMGRIATRSGRRVAGITEEAVQKLATHGFPGNLRELEGVLEKAMMSAQDGVVRGSDIFVGQASVTSHQGSGAHSLDWEAEAQWAPGRTLDQIERAVILKSLAFHNGNRTHTAR